MLPFISDFPVFHLDSNADVKTQVLTFCALRQNYFTLQQATMPLATPTHILPQT